MKVALTIVALILLLFGLFKLLFHSACKGNEGIPWWQNSGCSCKGLLLGSMSNDPKIVGAGAKYCIGILEEK